jgi:hypothetical protein
MLHALLRAIFFSSYTTIMRFRLAATKLSILTSFTSTSTSELPVIKQNLMPMDLAGCCYSDFGVGRLPEPAGLPRVRTILGSKTRKRDPAVELI